MTSKPKPFGICSASLVIDFLLNKLHFRLAKDELSQLNPSDVFLEPCIGSTNCSVLFDSTHVEGLEVRCCWVGFL